MSLIKNGIFILSYLSAAVIVGLGIYLGGVTTDPVAAIAVSLGVLLLGVLFHHRYPQSRPDQTSLSTTAAMELAQKRIEKEIVATRKDINNLAAVIEQVVERVVRHKPSSGDNAVASEVRTLEALERQVSEPSRDQEAPPSKLTVDTVPALTAAGDTVDDELHETIRNALNESRVDIYLQPMVRLPQRKPTYYEAYSHLRDADNTVLQPAKYISLAESTGLITAIDNNLLFRCIQIARKSRRRNLNFGFFCNISQFTLSDTSFFPEFIEFMWQNTDLAENLIFEFAYSDLMVHDSYIVNNLDRLGNLGFRFSVDRVDDLHINIKELASRHVSFTKLEANTALNAPRNSGEPLLFYETKNALESAGIQLIIEKIEQEEQLLHLLDYDIGLGQGYLFGTPRLSREI